MLRAFYPYVSPAELARAFRERPEYFAGGTIIGTSQDALRLPDGRIFDLISNAGGPQGTTHWQVIVPGGSGPGDIFGMEPGPLTPIVGEQFTPPVPGPSFETIVAGALEQIGGSDAVLGAAAHRVAEAAARAPGFEAGSVDLDDAAGVVTRLNHPPNAGDFADIVSYVQGVDREIEATDADYDTVPPDVALPGEPGIPAWPTDGGVPPIDEGPGPQPH